MSEWTEFLCVWADNNTNIYPMAIHGRWYEMHFIVYSYVIKFHIRLNSCQMVYVLMRKIKFITIYIRSHSNKSILFICTLDVLAFVFLFL